MTRIRTSTYRQEIYQRWYQKLKTDPARYKNRLKATRTWNAKYRAEKSPKFVEMINRRKAKRTLNPFPRREQGRAYYAAVRSDPIAYRAMLEKTRKNYLARMARLRENPEKYRAYLENSKVYHRYYRIVLKNREAAVAP